MYINYCEQIRDQFLYKLKSEHIENYAGFNWWFISRRKRTDRATIEMREGIRDHVKFCNVSVKPGVQKLATRLPKNIRANFSRQSPRIFAAVYSCPKVSFASQIFASSAVLSILTTGHSSMRNKRERVLKLVVF